MVDERTEPTTVERCCHELLAAGRSKPISHDVVLPLEDVAVDSREDVTSVLTDEGVLGDVFHGLDAIVVLALLEQLDRRPVLSTCVALVVLRQFLVGLSAHWFPESVSEGLDELGSLYNADIAAETPP